MEQAMYEIEVADVNNFGGWVGYEPVREDVAKTLNYHMYLFFQNEYRIDQFAEGRKFIISIEDGSPEKVIGNACILKTIVGYGTPPSMNGYEIGVPAYARNIVKSLSRAADFVPENVIYTFSDVCYKDMKTDFNFIPNLMIRTPIETVDILLDSIPFVDKNLLYHYPHYFIIGDNRIKVLDDGCQIGG